MGVGDWGARGGGCARAHVCYRVIVMYVLYVLQGHRDVHAVCVTGASRCTCCVCYRGIVMYVLRVLQGHRDARAVCVTGAS